MDILQSNPIKIKLTIQQIIDGLKETDENQQRALANVFHKSFASHVYKVALSKCRNFRDAEDLAKDVAQETLIKAFKTIKNFSFPQDTPETEHSYIIKAWLGKIAENCFRKMYEKKKKDVSIEDNLLEIDDVFCPICSVVLVEEREFYVCPKGHYKTEITTLVQAKELPEDTTSFDLFEFLYPDSGIEIPNAFRVTLQAALNTIKEEHRHILLTYASEGCIDSKLHLSQDAMTELCKTYDTSSQNIRQIKKRTLDKIKKICFPTDK